MAPTSASAPVRGISSMATRLLLAELCHAWERREQGRVELESVGGVDAARRVRAGEPFDFVVLASDAIDQLAAAGSVRPESRRPLVHSGVAVAVRAGAARPAIHDEAALRTAVLGAQTIGYSTGPSGTALLRLFERWGISSEVQARIVQAPPGVPVGSLVASGAVALGFQQFSELMHLEGVDVLGPLPPEVQIRTTFTGAVCAQAAQPEAARRLLDALGAAQAAPIKQRHGMEPA